MRYTTATLGFGIFFSALSVAAVGAAELTNDDDITYTIDIVMGQGDASQERFILDPGETLVEICEAGCEIRLNNGTEQEFYGDEAVSIKNGEFVIAE